MEQFCYIVANLFANPVSLFILFMGIFGLVFLGMILVILVIYITQRK